MRNSSYNAYFSFLGEMGEATTRAPNGLGSPNPAKKLAHWVDLLNDQPLSRNHVLEILKGEPPLNLMTRRNKRQIAHI